MDLLLADKNMGNNLCRLIRFTETSLEVGDTGSISGRLVTFDIFLNLGSKLESELEWRNVLEVFCNKNIIKNNYYNGFKILITQFLILKMYLLGKRQE